MIIGCSGGYCLPPEFVARFREVQGWELDPLARFIFSRRFPGVATRAVNALTLRGKFAPEQLRECLPAGAVVLFTNVLGQLGYESREQDFDWTRLHRALEGREWATFHDRVSGFGKFAELPHEWGTDLDLARGFAGADEVESHETESLMPASAEGLRYFDWRITPKRVHRIEGFWVKR